MHQVELKYLFNGEPRSQVFKFEQDQWILRGDALAPEGRYQSTGPAAPRQLSSRRGHASPVRSKFIKNLIQARLSRPKAAVTKF